MKTLIVVLILAGVIGCSQSSNPVSQAHVVDTLVISTVTIDTIHGQCPDVGTWAVYSYDGDSVSSCRVYTITEPDPGHYVYTNISDKYSDLGVIQEEWYNDQCQLVKKNVYTQGILETVYKKEM